MDKYKYIFVVLVYKNIDVLEGFFESLHVLDNYKVVLVNSFYDETSKKSCKEYAERYDADFISVPNKGYSNGNNIGVSYACNHYEFDFLIISNSDIIVRSLGRLDSFKDVSCIIAPETKMLTGKNQNPNIVVNSSLYFYLLDLSSSMNKPIWGKLAHIISRLYREMFLIYSTIVRKDSYSIFSAHGSFLIITKEAMKCLFPIFNDSMFLYNEEGYLAFKAQYLHIPILYVPSISITHLEGASTNQNHQILEKENRNSYIIMRNCVKSSNFGIIAKK